MVVNLIIGYVLGCAVSFLFAYQMGRRDGIREAERAARREFDQIKKERS